MKRIVGIAAVLAMLAAACGGDSGSSESDGADAAPPTSTAVTGSVPTTQTQPSETTPPATEPTFTGSGSSDFCEAAREFSEAGDEAFEPGVDLDQALEQLEDFEPQLSEVVDKAPSEIKDDVETLADGFRAVIVAFRNAEGDFFAAASELEPLLSDPAFTEAGDNLDVYLRDVCGIDTSEDLADLGEFELDVTALQDILEALPPEQLEELLAGLSATLGGIDPEELAADPEALAALLNSLGGGNGDALNELFEGIDDLETGPNAFGDDPELDALWTACEGGDYEACDSLFFESPFGSEYEAFGDSCGNRNEPGGLCVDLYG